MTSQVQSSPSPRSNGATYSLPRARILLVDDEETSIHILSAMLRADYTTSISRSAEDALVRLTTEIPDVIISDVEMPGIGGLEFTRRLKASVETAHVPVLLVTARTDPAAVGECLDAGADDYLPKPVRRHELLARARSAVRASRLQREVQITLGELHAANAALSQNLDRLRRLGSDLGMAQKLESIAQLASGLAHEINTPAQFVGDNLSFLQTSLEQLLAQLFRYRQCFRESSNQEPNTQLVAELRRAEAQLDLDFLATELPQSIAQSQAGMDRIVDVVRVMERYSVGSGDWLVPMDVHALLDAAIEASNDALEHVEVERNFDLEIPPIGCLVEELTHAFSHLLGNAAWAINQVRPVNTHPRKITISTRKLEQFIELRFSDTGCGIPSENYSRIFDPYFTTKPEGEGTGQGLPFAHAVIVARQHGSIRFETAVGKGSTFIVRLPLYSEASSSLPQSMTTGAPSATMR